MSLRSYARSIHRSGSCSQEGQFGGFFDPSVGCLARMRTKILRKSYAHNPANSEGRMVWLDAAETLGELQPGRDTRKMMDILNIFEQSKEDPKTLTSNLQDLSVARDTVVMVTLKTCPPVFTVVGKALYTLEERQQVTSGM